jgi:hypothetical protein
LSCAKAIALAVITPTMTPPISPVRRSRRCRPVSQAELGLGQRIGHQPVEPLEMGACGDLRHHAAEAAVLGQLAVDDIGQDPPHRLIPGRRLDDGDRRLVAARFDAQDAHPCLLALEAGLR